MAKVAPALSFWTACITVACCAWRGAKRVRGYYALPMLWRGQVIGWANVVMSDGQLQLQPGYIDGQAPKDTAFKPALQQEQLRLEQFLGLHEPCR